MKRSLLLSTLAVLTLLAAVTVPAYAQATRTWVSGVGDDANPCSRTAPCKTFAGAISKTAPGGEINVLDPGGFGAVTITKPITISSEGFEAGVLVSGTNGIVVSVPNATDTVILRGLDIEGLGTGINGVTVLTGGNVTIEKCLIHAFTTSGINFTPTVANTQLHVADTIIRNNGGTTGQAVLINASGAMKGNFNNVRIESNNSGLRVLSANANVTVYDSTAAGNTNAGFATGASGALTIEHSVSTNNGTGVVCGGGVVRMGNNSITLNGTAVNTSGGNCNTFKNNDIDVTTPIAGLTQINPQ